MDKILGSFFRPQDGEHPKPPPPPPVLIVDDTDELAKDQQTVKSIPDIWFDGNFDPVRDVLESLPEENTLGHMMQVKLQHQEKLDAVNRVLSDVVLSHHQQFVTEMQRVAELQRQLEVAHIICKNGRRSLAKAHHEVVELSLKVITKERKKTIMLHLLKSLAEIRGLHHMQSQISQLLAGGEYAQAVAVCLECLNKTQALARYSCMAQLDTASRNARSSIEQELRKVQKALCRDYHEEQYITLLQAYSLLDSHGMTIDRQNTVLCEALTDAACTVARESFRDLTRSSSFGDFAATPSVENLGQLSYEECCLNLAGSELYISTMGAICSSLCDVMQNHMRVAAVHNVQAPGAPPDENARQRDDVDPKWFSQPIKEKIAEGRRKVWLKAQEIMTTYLYEGGTQPPAYQSYKIDDFLRILVLLDRFVAYGELYSDVGGETLQYAARQKAGQFFSSFHRAKLEDIKAMLEAEAWQQCPVQAGFNLYSLKECAFMRPDCNDDKGSSVLEAYTAKGRAAVLECFMQGQNPFNNGLANTASVTAMDRFASKGRTDEDGEEDINEELYQDYIHESSDSLSSNSFTTGHMQGEGDRPIVTTTTLNVVRYAGRYIQMMELLPDTAFDILVGLTQLFDYYAMAVYYFFAVPLIATMPLSAQQNGSPLIGLADLLGLDCRIVGAESLQFVGDAFTQSRPYLDLLVPPHKKSFLDQFYANTVDVIPELREYIYRTIAARLLNYEAVLAEMVNIKWDLRDITTQHNRYVDIMLAELTGFASRLGAIASTRHVPARVQQVLWEQVIRFTMFVFIEGFANARRCSNEGRALMMLDLKQFLSKLEQLTPVRPIPLAEVVESFIKAYYLTDKGMEQWIRSRPELTHRQLSNFLNYAAATLTKRDKQRLQALVDERDKSAVTRVNSSRTLGERWTVS